MGRAAAGLVHKVLRRLLRVLDRLGDGRLEGGHYVGAVRRGTVEELTREGVGVGLEVNGRGEGGVGVLSVYFEI